MGGLLSAWFLTLAARDTGFRDPRCVRHSCAITSRGMSSGSAPLCRIHTANTSVDTCKLVFRSLGCPAELGYLNGRSGHNALLALVLNFPPIFRRNPARGVQYRGQGAGKRAAAGPWGSAPWSSSLKITLPQARLARMFPRRLAASSSFCFLTTGIISEIGVRDLTNAGIFIDSRTFRTFEVFVTLTRDLHRHFAQLQGTEWLGFTGFSFHGWGCNDEGYSRRNLWAAARHCPVSTVRCHAIHGLLVADRLCRGRAFGRSHPRLCGLRPTNGASGLPLPISGCSSPLRF